MSHRQTQEFLNGHRFRDRSADRIHDLERKLENNRQLLAMVDRALAYERLSHAQRDSLHGHRFDLIQKRDDLRARMSELEGGVS